MYKIVIAVCCSLMIFIACQPKNKQASSNKMPLADTAKFYPIDNFVKMQMQQVDLADYTIRKTFTRDSVEQNDIIDKAQFLAAAADVLSAAKQFTQQKQQYKETVFQDLSTASYTINYTALDASIPIQRVDVLLSEETNIIKRLLIRELIQLDGQSEFRQISWLANQQFQISSPRNDHGKWINEMTVISWKKEIK